MVYDARKELLDVVVESFAVPFVVSVHIATKVIVAVLVSGLAKLVDVIALAVADATALVELMVSAYVVVEDDVAKAVHNPEAKTRNEGFPWPQDTIRMPRC